MKFVFKKYIDLFGWGSNQHFYKRPIKEKIWKLYSKNKFDSYVYFIIEDYKIIRIGSSSERTKNGAKGKDYFFQRIPNVFREKLNKKVDRNKCKLFIYFINNDKFGYKCQSVEYDIKHRYYLKHNEKPLYDVN